MSDCVAGHLSSLLPGTACISVLPSTEPEKPGSGVCTSQHWAMLSNRDAFLLCRAAELCSDGVFWLEQMVVWMENLFLSCRIAQRWPGDSGTVGNILQFSWAAVGDLWGMNWVASVRVFLDGYVLCQRGESQAGAEVGDWDCHAQRERCCWVVLWKLEGAAVLFLPQKCFVHLVLA